jgi:DNA phosphorothioation-dependent restriction protein DptG
MIDRLLGLFKRKKKQTGPRVIEHRGMKVYLSQELIDEFDKAGVDYEKGFRESVDELLDEEEELDRDNPYR